MDPIISAWYIFLRLSEMLHQEFAPPEALRDVVKCFWYNRKDFGEQLSTFEVVPDGYAEIVFHFGSGIFAAEGSQPLHSPFLVGLLSQPVVFHAKNRLEIIGIRCFPWSVFDLLRLPANKGEMHLFGHPIARLQSAMEDWVLAGRIEEAVVLAEQYLRSARAGMVADSTLLEAGIAMLEANGSLPVSQIAAASHATVRTLERNFKRSSGHTLKNVSGLMRFEQARNRLWLHSGFGLADLARELGYADQSHLSREFKRYSGTTPAAFARKAKENRR